MIKFISKVLLILLCFLQSCKDEDAIRYREFSSSFENVNEFSSFYIVPQGNYDSYHELVNEAAIDGQFSHKAWIIQARDTCNDGATYLPHRAYPTIQFHKTKEGAFKTPCLISLWVKLQMSLQAKGSGRIDDWFSFATLSPDASDNWARTVLINLTPDGYLKLVHVPNQGEQIRNFQASYTNDISGDLLFPQNEWVRLDIYIDFNTQNGYAKVWQNQNLVSAAKVNGGNELLQQAHFGLYASAAINEGSIYNDKLRIKEVANEAEALQLIKTLY
ncbi:MAG: heparin lyase I family protein [Paludibacteraceae bacterium]|nr:heparin lyase I family protein [Paludibacteraceae bacterium]MBN2787993.1 heparin lyase I family protein [Paludibacteraceae bacterium]